MRIIAMNSYQRNNNNQTAFGGDKELAATLAKFTEKAILKDCKKPIKYVDVVNYLQKSANELIEEFKSYLEFDRILHVLNLKSFRFKNTDANQSIRLNCHSEAGLIKKITIFETDWYFGPTRVTNISYLPERGKISVSTDKYEKLLDIIDSKIKPQNLSSSIINLGD